MDFGSTIAFAALMATIISFCGMVYSAYSERLKLKAKEIELRMAELGRTAPGDASLEDRVRVLERIATDRSALHGQNLALEIEALRSNQDLPAGTTEKELHA